MISALERSRDEVHDREVELLRTLACQAAVLRMERELAAQLPEGDGDPGGTWLLREAGLVRRCLGEGQPLDDADDEGAQHWL